LPELETIDEGFEIEEEEIGTELEDIDAELEDIELEDEEEEIEAEELILRSSKQKNKATRNSHGDHNEQIKDFVRLLEQVSWIAAKPWNRLTAISIKQSTICVKKACHGRQARRP